MFFKKRIFSNKLVVFINVKRKWFKGKKKKQIKIEKSYSDLNFRQILYQIFYSNIEKIIELNSIETTIKIPISLLKGEQRRDC